MVLRPLCKELQEKAEKELHEVPSQINEDIKVIREWILAQPHLKSRTDDQWLVTFLRGCKFDHTRVKEKINLLYTKQSQLPEFFANRDPFLPEIQEVLNRGILIVLPKTIDAAAPRIIILRAHLCDAVKVPATLFIKVLLMILEILHMEDDNFAVAGISYLTDLQNLPYNYVTQITPVWVKNVVSCMLRAYPSRLKAAYFVNAPWFFQIIYKLLQFFLPSKLKNRVYFYSDFDSLNENIPKSILPMDYGGEEKSCGEIAAEWKSKVEDYCEWFLEYP